MTLEYALNGSPTYSTWATLSSGSNVTLDVSSLGLQPTDWITSLRWLFNPGGATASGWATTATISGIITSPDRDSNVVVAPTNMVNAVYLDWGYFPTGAGGSCSDVGAVCNTDTGKASVSIVPMPVPKFSKASAGGVSAAQRFLFGQSDGYFTLNYENDTGIALDNLTLTDDIPAPFALTSFRIGSYTNFSGTITVRYQASDNPGVWVD